MPLCRLMLSLVMLAFKDRLQPLEFRFVLLRAERYGTRLPKIARYWNGGWLTNGLLGMKANMLSD